MPTFTNTRTLLGDAGALDALVSHSLETFADDIISEIGKYGFFHHDELKIIYLPNVMRIGLCAFNGCTNLQKVYLGLNQNAIASLYNNNCFTETGHCTILVPDDLVSVYRITSPWTNHADYIYGANDATAPFWDETEIEDDIETIASYVNAGTAASRYNLGQYKTIDLGSEGQIRMQIVGKNMRELANSTQTAQLEWVAMDLLKTAHRFNPVYEQGTDGTGGVGGYSKSELRTYINNDIWALVPPAWQGMIKETKITSCYYNASGAKVTDDVTTEKLRIPSYGEVADSTWCETTGVTYRFAMRQSNPTTRIRKRSDGLQAYGYWLRSGAAGANAYYISNNGAYNTVNATTAYYILLAFST